MSETTSETMSPVVEQLGTGTIEPTYTPVGMVIQVLEHIHTVVGVPWWVTIAGTTLLIRTALIPVMVSQQRNIGRLAFMRPEMEALTAQFKGKMGDVQASEQYKVAMSALCKKHDCHPMKSFSMMLINMPIFITFFLALRKMSENLDSFREGGLLWFVDLSAQDPTYVLPLICGASFFLTVELGGETGAPASQQTAVMRNVLRFFAVAMVPICAQFPTALFCYWITSNGFSLLQVLIFKNKVLRRALDLPDMSKLPKPGQAPAPAPVVFPTVGLVGSKEVSNTSAKHRVRNQRTSKAKRIAKRGDTVSHDE